MRGNFLSSTWNPLGGMASREDNKQYALTAADIDAWTETVRHERGRIMDVVLGTMMRDQNGVQV